MGRRSAVRSTSVPVGAAIVGEAMGVGKLVRGGGGSGAPNAGDAGRVGPRWYDGFPPIGVSRRGVGIVRPGTAGVARPIGGEPPGVARPNAVEPAGVARPIGGEPAGGKAAMDPINGVGWGAFAVSGGDCSDPDGLAGEASFGVGFASCACAGTSGDDSTATRSDWTATSCG
ncbi:MAG: hypothetical protein MNPFHGCM_01128 [Gemmatimonadaceae bacterium]|nr:hypothetical protein [Gemmatimonadaceae bacterium]